MDQNPEELPEFKSQSHINESRRRRVHRQLIPSGKTEHALYVNEFTKRLTPDLDFFLRSMLCGVVLGAAILLDHPVLYLLAALAAPFLCPLIGLGFTTAVGSLSFFGQSFFSLVVGSAFVFAGGAIGGWISKLFKDLTLNQLPYHLNISAWDILAVVIGIGVAVFVEIRNPKQKPVIASILLAYEILVPMGAAGFALTSGNIEGFLSGIKFTGINLLIVIAAGAIVSSVLRLRPYNAFGYIVIAALACVGLYALIVSSAFGSTLQSQLLVTVTPTVKNLATADVPTSTPTFQPSKETVEQTLTDTTPTNTLVPTRTPTATMTPKPTAMWGKVHSDTYNGIVVRAEPGFSSERLTSLLNDQVVQILPGEQFIDNTYWVHVIMDDGKEGWVVQSLLITATPSTN